MPDWCRNRLLVVGHERNVQEFMQGLLKVGDGYRLLESYVPVPKELDETEVSSIGDIAYDLHFNPDQAAYLESLGLPWVMERGIETREQLIELLTEEYPEAYELGLKYHKNMAKYGYKNWYDFIEDNWGCTKVDFNTKLVDQGPNHLRFEFFSAWSPPLEGFDRIAAQFCELEFELAFAEPGMGFRGIAHWQDGRVVWEQSEPWEEDVEEDSLSDELQP